MNSQFIKRVFTQFWLGHIYSFGNQIQQIKSLKKARIIAESK